MIYYLNTDYDKIEMHITIPNKYLSKIKWESGRVGGSKTQLCPWTHQGNSYTYTTKSENDFRIGRTDLPQLVIKKRP